MAKYQVRAGNAAIIPTKLMLKSTRFRGLMPEMSNPPLRSSAARRNVGQDDDFGQDAKIWDAGYTSSRTGAVQ